MSRESRLLQPGAMVNTDFSGKWTAHKIIERGEFRSQSGVGFRVAPIVPGSTGGLMDADWFVPANPPSDTSDDIDGDEGILAENGL
jgi:hypothetical protein